MPLQQAFSLVDRKDTELVSVLRQLLAIDTTNPPGMNYRRMVDYLDSRTRLLGFRNQRIVVPEEQWRKLPVPLEGPRVNLVCRKHFGPDLEDVTIAAPMDTVPVEGEWSFDPFLGQIEMGRIYGRGTSDAKGSIASLIVAFEVIGQLRLSCKYNVTLCFYTDEEVGGYPGPLELAKRGFFQGHVLYLEGTQQPDEFLAAPGMVDVHVTTKGRSCHSSVNFLGVNAVEEMLPIAAELMALKQRVEAREYDIPADTHGGLRSGRMQPTFTLSLMRGGEKSNVVPAECTLIINRRFTPGETLEAVVGEIRAAVDRGRANSKALDVVIETLPGFPPFLVDLGNSNARKLREARKLVNGYQDGDFLQIASERARSAGYVQQVTGARKFYFMGVARPDSHMHGTDESCRLEDMHNLTKELVYYLTA